MEIDLSNDMKNRQREILTCLNWSQPDISAQLGEENQNLMWILTIFIFNLV